MRKHDVRKWLHAVLDLLPVILIPVFMVYSHRHSLTSPVTRVVAEPIYYETNDVNSVDDFVVGNVYHFDATNSDYSGSRGRCFISDYWILSELPTSSSTTTPYTLPYFYFYEYGMGVVFSNENNDYYYAFPTKLSLDFVYRYDSDELLEPLLSSITKCRTHYVKEYQEVTITEDKGVSIVVPVPTHHILRQNVINGYAYNTFNWVNYFPDVDFLEYYSNRHELFFDVHSGSSEFYNTAHVNINHNDIIYFTYEVSGDLVGGNAHAFSIEYVNNDDIYFEDGTHDITKGKHSYYYQYLGNDGDDMFLMFSTSIEGEYYFRNIQMFNLTEIFGSGNEPTKEEFESLLTKEYYDYDTDYDVIFGTHDVVYDDSDVMSQVMYQLYNSVDKYFNMGNVFNMTGVYDWFNFNIFNGNAPISIYIVWNIVLYEFVMDLLFLLYGLFMWFIDMVEKLMEKPLKSVK